MDEIREIQSQPGDREQRLDRFLALRCPEISRARLQELIRAGAVTRDGAPLVRPSERLQGGELLRLHLAPRPPLAVAPQPLPLRILYQDDDLVVVDKPAGMTVHPGAGCREGTLANALLHHFQHLSTQGGADRPGIVHRLDRLTSGVLVVARNDAAHLALARQFQQRTVEKSYAALAHGWIAAPAGQVDAPIDRDLRRRTRMTTRRRGGREALTEYRVRERFAVTLPRPAGRVAWSWLEVRIHTGRTHQIRVHLASIGHPIVGDTLYGAPAVMPGPGPLRGQALPRVFLHSARLCLHHPRSGERLCFQAPLPPLLEQWLQILRSACDEHEILPPTGDSYATGAGG